MGVTWWGVFSLFSWAQKGQTWWPRATALGTHTVHTPLPLSHPVGAVVILEVQSHDLHIRALILTAAQVRGEKVKPGPNEKGPYFLHRAPKPVWPATALVQGLLVSGGADLPKGHPRSLSLCTCTQRGPVTSRGHTAQQFLKCCRRGKRPGLGAGQQKACRQHPCPSCRLCGSRSRVGGRRQEVAPGLGYLPRVSVGYKTRRCEAEGENRGRWVGVPEPGFCHSACSTSCWDKRCRSRRKPRAGLLAPGPSVKMHRPDPQSRGLRV